MMILSLFLQVSYALDNSENHNVNSNKFKLNFSNIEHYISDETAFTNLDIKNVDDTKKEEALTVLPILPSLGENSSIYIYILALVFMITGIFLLKEDKKHQSF